MLLSTGIVVDVNKNVAYLQKPTKQSFRLIGHPVPARLRAGPRGDAGRARIRPQERSDRSKTRPGSEKEGGCEGKL